MVPSITVHVPVGHRLDNENDHTKSEEMESSGPFGASWTIWILPINRLRLGLQPIKKQTRLLRVLNFFFSCTHNFQDTVNFEVTP